MMRAVGLVMHMVGNAGAFAAEQQGVAGGSGSGVAGSAALVEASTSRRPSSAARLFEAVPVDVAGEGDGGDIIHAGAFQVLVGKVEAGGLDDVDGKPRQAARRRIVPVLPGMSGW